VSQLFTARYDRALETPSLARHERARWLPESMPESERGALRLLVSELVTNAVRHVNRTTQPIELAVRIDDGAIRVEVGDGGAGFKPGKPRPRGADGGFGLFLVERIATRWGVDTRDGTRVWFELDLGHGGS
jgi:anti-sigma regulatory factor (Ser/Thr protein kinase)